MKTNISSHNNEGRCWGPSLLWLGFTVAVLIVAACDATTTKEDDPRLKAPWVASIFLKNPENGLWEYICGGTITSSSTVLTSARCILPRVVGEKFSSRPYHYNYANLQVVAGLKTSSLEKKDEFAQIAFVGQIRDHFSKGDNPDTPFKDLAAIRLKTQFNLTTPYVKSVALLEHAETILEANATKSGNVVTIAGFDIDTATVQTRSKSNQPLKIYEITLTDVGTCIDLYTKSYDAFYFDVFCGKSLNSKETIPCNLRGAGMIVTSIKYSKDSPEANYLLGVYSSNTALAKTEGVIKSKNRLPIIPCGSTDFIFFSKIAYLGRWGISNEFCGYDLAMCRNDKCRPWEDVCNGSPQCEDSSDESPQMCFNRGVCAANQFRCKYGACIDKSKVCDGVLDCHFDGSDEDSEGVCKNTKAVTAGTTKIVTGCATIPVQKGVDARCSHPERKDTFSCSSGNILVGTTAIVKANEVRATCTKDGVWSQKVDIKCTQ